MFDDPRFKFDMDKQYLVPMSRLDMPENIEELVQPMFKETAKGTIVVLTKEGYRDKSFHKEYFEWLIYTNYIKVNNS